MTSSPSFSALRAQRTPKHKLDDATERLIREADVAAVRRAGYARVVVACILLLSVLATTTGRELTDELVRRQVRIGEVTMVLFGVFGLLSAWLASRRIAVPALPAVTATLDAALILGNLAYSHWGLGVPGALFSTFPVVWVAPIAMAATAIHYHPALQAYVAFLYLAGFSLIAFSGDWLTFGSVFGADELTGQYSWQANLVRLVMLFATALMLLVVARQGRALLERAVRETTMRLSLTRYLPSELAPILTDQEFAELRSGRRITATLLFVDIRASSTFAETMDPNRLAIFMSAFRRRVMRATAQTGGVIDKFTGDGALILFGVPSGKPSDPERAIACGHLLRELIRRWNEKRNFDPPVRIGIGIHTGEVFCGVVGDKDRLEFTVLGETVNIAARIEQATKVTDQPLLVSQETLDAAGETDGWIEIDCPPLPGINRPLKLMAPIEASS